MITVEYLNTDTSALHTVYYEFASQEMVDDASTSSFDVWPSSSPRASLIPQPSSTYLTNLMDDDLFGLSFSVIGATSTDLSNTSTTVSAWVGKSSPAWDRARTLRQRTAMRSPSISIRPHQTSA